MTSSVLDQLKEQRCNPRLSQPIDGQNQDSARYRWQAQSSWTARLSL